MLGKILNYSLQKRPSEVVFTILLGITPQSLPGLAESGEIFIVCIPLAIQTQKLDKYFSLDGAQI